MTLPRRAHLTLAYGIDDFFFPGSRNIFERQAGLTRAERRPASPRTTS